VHARLVFAVTGRGGALLTYQLEQPSACSCRLKKTTLSGIDNTPVGARSWGNRDATGNF